MIVLILEHIPRTPGRIIFMKLHCFMSVCGHMWSEAYALPELPMASIHPSVSS